MEPASVNNENTPLIAIQNKLDATEDEIENKTACFRDFCDRLGLSISVTFIISGVILDVGAILAYLYLPPIPAPYYKLSIFFGSVAGVAGTGGLVNEVVKLQPKPSATLQTV